MAALPDILPIFPLTGVLLLPEMWLPLNIFEPRYRAMVEDVKDAGAHIGIIQPVVPREDNRPPPGATPENPEVYPVGCAGRLEQCERLEDGRFYIQLQGVTRFRIVEELPLLNGYRRVRPDYSAFTKDGVAAPAMDTADLIQALLRFGQANGLPFDAARLQSLPGNALVNGLSMSLPFGAAEKQALLEAAGLPERQALLLTLLGMGLKASPEQPASTPPTLN